MDRPVADPTRLGVDRLEAKKAMEEKHGPFTFRPYHMAYETEDGILIPYGTVIFGYPLPEHKHEEDCPCRSKN